MPRGRWVAAATRDRPVALYGYVGSLLVAAALLTGLLEHSAPAPAPAVAAPLIALPGLGALVVAAELLRIRFRVGADVDAVTLVEAVLAPLIVAFPSWRAVVTVAAAELVAARLRRNTPVKAAFNVAQWSLATAVGVLVLRTLALPDAGLSARTAAALVAALMAIGAVNVFAFIVVLAVASGQRLSAQLRALAPVSLPGWGGGWLLNSLLGVFNVAAFVTQPAMVAVFVVPMLVLHGAYRGYAAARGDRQRLAALHRAAQTLAEPLDPRSALADFLEAVRTGFDAQAVALVLIGERGREVHHLDPRDSPAYRVVAEDFEEPTLAGALAAQPGSLRASVNDGTPVGAALRAAGWRTSRSAPMLVDGRLAGALILFDQGGVDPSKTAEAAILEALGRETAAAFARGALVSTVVEERRRLAEIVTTTSDGILTVSADGSVADWNPAMAKITGLAAAEVLAGRDGLARLRLRTLAGQPVDLAAWTLPGAQLPAELRMTASDGVDRRLLCSYSRAVGDDGEAHALVVVARDITATEQVLRLQHRVSELAESEAAQREVVEQLQKAVMPECPAVEACDLAVAYLPSEDVAPTGGDLYDWQVLPGGDLHLAVVDVIGHGVAATKDALTVVHTLRTLAAAATPLEELIARADELIGRQHENLVATVLVARYDPRTGELRVAAGGHPPALVVDPTGQVRQVTATGGPIGWPGAGSDAVARVMLVPGSTVVLYTDGLIEARKNILQGMDELVAHAGAIATWPAAEFADELMARALAGAVRRDDSLVLLLRRHATATPQQRPPDGDHRPALDDR